jgi:hypothetical protein
MKPLSDYCSKSERAGACKLQTISYCNHESFAHGGSLFHALIYLLERGVKVEFALRILKRTLGGVPRAVPYISAAGSTHPLPTVLTCINHYRTIYCVFYLLAFPSIRPKSYSFSSIYSNLNRYVLGRADFPITIL